MKELEDIGWNVFIAWECEINNKNKFKDIKSKILNFLRKDIKSINA